MATDLSTTSYALLGLLALDPAETDGLTAYELKQRCDRTMRFYWVSPATSQVYTELSRLARLDLVDSSEESAGRRSTTRYRLNDHGRERLVGWLRTSPPPFPVLKHPVALRMMFGAMVTPDVVEGWLRRYLDELTDATADLAEVRTMLGDNPVFASPAMVADWGLSFFANEQRTATEMIDRLAGADRPAPPLA